MATGKVIGQIQVTQGNIKIVGVDGVVRNPVYEGFMYEKEQIISNDPDALFQIKFLALPEASAYDGVFRILADGSVIHGRDAMDSMMSDENLVKVLETASVGDVKTAGEDIGDLETAAGEEGAVGSSSFTETDIVAESSVLGFSRGANGALGFGITDFGSVPDYDAAQITPPAITSPNEVIYDENDTIPVIQITATAEGAVTYGIGGLDSGFFDIDSATGLVTFKESPDFENPRDSGGDNEYNTYVTVTDAFGNYTTQLLSVSINNVNERPSVEDVTVTADETFDTSMWDNWTQTFPFYNPDEDAVKLNDEYKNWIKGTLIATDEDTLDTHTFSLSDMTDGTIIENVNYDTNGILWEGQGQVDVRFDSSYVDASVITVDAILLSSNNGTDSDTNFYLVGDFNALGAGETATITFKYYATDSSVNDGEPMASEPKFVSVTVVGTNDQPVVENVAISTTETYDLLQWWDANRDGNPTNDDFDNMIFGRLVASDEDVNDNHIFGLDDMYLSRHHGSDKELIDVDYDINGFASGGHGTVKVLFESSAINAEDIELDKIFFYDNNGRDSDTRFSLQGDFDALGAGETATITFKYYATDTSSGSQEPNESEAKLVTITITGTNDQPVVENVAISAYETYDANPWDNWTQTFPFYNPDADNGIGLNDEHNNWVKGTLSAIDEDVNDVHTFSLSDMRGGTIIEGVNYDTNGIRWGGTGQVDVRFSSSDVDVDAITVNAILLSSDNGRDSDTDFYLVGDFNALGAGETATITFKYYATDSSSGSQEPNDSAARLVSITVTGTNDQPVVSDINVNSLLSTVTFVEDNAGYANVLGIYQVDAEGNPTNPQYILLNSDSANNGDILGTFDFSDPELQYFIISDGAGSVNVGDTLAFNGAGQLTINGSVATSVIYSETSRNGGETGIAVEQLSDGSIKISFDDQLGNGDDNDFNDLIINISNRIYESTSTGNIFSDLDNSDVWTTFNGNLATAQDDDVNDTHMYELSGDVNVASDDLDTSLLTDVNVTVNADGSYTLSGNFNALAAGDTATVTFQYVANDGTSDPYGETNLSDAKTVTLTITGTNDAPTATPDNVTVDTDTVYGSEDVLPFDISSFTYDGNFRNSDIDNSENSNDVIYHGAYAVNDLNSTTTTETIWVKVWVGHHLEWVPQTQEVTTYDGDRENQIDSKGTYNEGIVFAFSDEVSKATVVFDNSAKNVGKDEVAIRVYNEEGEYRVVSTAELSGHDQSIDIEIAGFDFDRVVIYALEPQNPGCDVSEFRVESVAGVVDTQTEVLSSFIIDDAALLANDSDIDEDDELEVGLGLDTNLYLGDTDTIVGSVSLDENGDILVTPNAVEFEENADGYARFDYTIDDGNGGVATTTATIDVRLGSLVEGDVYDSTVDNIVVVDDDSLDLSDVSNISVIQLEGDATVTGSVEGINAADVIGATGDDNTLYITSLDGDASNQVDVDTDSLHQIENVNIDGVGYTSYSDGDATLLIQIQDVVVPD